MKVHTREFFRTIAMWTTLAVAFAGCVAYAQCAVDNRCPPADGHDYALTWAGTCAPVKRNGF